MIGISREYLALPFQERTLISSDKAPNILLSIEKYTVAGETEDILHSEL